MNRRHRLRGRAAFRAVREQRAASATESLRVAVGANDAGVARVGFAIPRTVGGAVERNRLRRRLRESLRPHLAGLEGIDVVVSVRPPVTRLATAELAAEVARCTEAARTRLAVEPSARKARRQ